MGNLAQNTFKTPQQVMQERLAQQQAMYASAQSPYERMGMALGNILGGALGVKDPAMERASTTQSIYNAVLQNNPDTNSAEFYNELARTLAAAGLGAEANYALQEARKYQVQERELGLRERGVAATERQVEQAEERIGIEREKLKADLAREARQGLLTQAQIRQIDAQIANLGSAYEYQVLKGPAGETTGILAINKKDPNDVKQIQLGETTAPVAPATGGGATWNYVPGQGMVKAP
jgi:hypothetical protein